MVHWERMGYGIIKLLFINPFRDSGLWFSVCQGVKKVTSDIKWVNPV